MKTITLYECEICKRRYPTSDDAHQCEAKGAPRDPRPENPYPRGMIFYNASDPNNFYHNITFVAAEDGELTGMPSDPHWPRKWHFTLMWAFRDNGAGDSHEVGDVCGGGIQDPSRRSCDIPDSTHPTFKRAVAFLKKHKIPITVWNGYRAVPYVEGD